MRIRVFSCAREAGVYAAALAEQTILSSEHPVLGLSTGSTALPFYDALAGLTASGLDVSRTVTVNLDEYVGLGADHPQSFHRFMHEHLFARLAEPFAESHLPRGDAPDLAAECRAYDEILRRHPIDLQILGIGLNGHIGFNEPGHVLHSATHVVPLSGDTRRQNARFFGDAQAVPSHALTIGVQSILAARRIVLMAFGAAKADIVARAFGGEVSTEVPASVLQLHRDVTLVLDETAAARLPRRGC